MGKVREGGENKREGRGKGERKIVGREGKRERRRGEGREWGTEGKRNM